MNRHPLVTLAMILGGILMLLPGVCSVALALTFYKDLRGSDIGVVGVLVAVCLLISFGGIMLLRKATK